jgi:hypothetical protein
MRRFLIPRGSPFSQTDAYAIVREACAVTVLCSKMQVRLAFLPLIRFGVHHFAERGKGGRNIGPIKRHILAW